MRRYSCGVAACSSSTDFLRSLYRGGDIRACLGRRYICRATDLRETLRKEPPEVCERDYLVSASNIHVADTRFVSREIQLRHFPKPFRDIGNLHELVDGLLATAVLSARAPLWRTIKHSQ